MNTAIPIDCAGGIALPREVRRRLELQPDSILVLSVVAQRFDAAAATRDERTAHSHRRTHR